jgi:hypothetical protein
MQQALARQLLLLAALAGAYLVPAAAQGESCDYDILSTECQQPSYAPAPNSSTCCLTSSCNWYA